MNLAPSLNLKGAISAVERKSIFNYTSKYNYHKTLIISKDGVNKLPAEPTKKYFFYVLKIKIF